MGKFTLLGCLTMAKKCQINRDLKRIDLIQAQRSLRANLKKIIIDPNASDEDKFKAQRKIQRLSRNGSRTRKTTRCAVSGRSHAVYQKFGLSRIAFRTLALEGKLPGVIKASW